MRIGWTTVAGAAVGALLSLRVAAQDMDNLIRQGKLQEAKRLLVAMEKENRSHDSVLFLRGLLSADGDSAAAYYEDYASRFPNGRFREEALFRIAQLKYVQGLYRSSQARFRQLLQSNPQSPLSSKCHFWLGMCHSALGEKDSALVWFEQLKTKFPSSELTGLIPAGMDVRPGPAPLPAGEKEKPALPTPSYSVQIGAFSNQNNALLRKAFFEREGYPVFLNTKQKEGDTLFLVWIGRFPTLEEAKKFGEAIRIKYGTGYTLVSD